MCDASQLPPDRLVLSITSMVVQLELLDIRCRGKLCFAGYVSFPGQPGPEGSSVADSPPPMYSILLLRFLLKGCTGSIFHHPCAMLCAAHKHQCAPPALSPLL